jgi:hypothetical protein
MLNLEPLKGLPNWVQLGWRATLQRAEPTIGGVFRLVDIVKTEPLSWQEGKIIVQVVDENGFPLPNVKVAFSYSTADQYLVHSDFKWQPPSPWQADVVHTEGGGRIEHVQGSPVKEGQPGGVTVYIVEPEYSSDVVTGCGALADHTGLLLTFKLSRVGVVPIREKIAEIEDRLDVLLSAVRDLLGEANNP